MKSEFLNVARKLMETERQSLSPQKLVDLGLKRQLFSDKIAGKTPHQTMKAKLSVHIRRFGERSPFVRTAPGRFYLRHLLNGSSEPFQAKPISPPKSTERVLVYRATELDKLTTWQGLKTSWKKISRTMFSRLSPHYYLRFDVEEDNDHTQILTYVLVTKGDAILAYRRGTYNRTEQYLRGSFCVGFGGHVTEADSDLFNMETMGVFECASRELMEELHLPPPDIERLRGHKGLHIIGIINDDSTDVGRRHLALVMKYEVSPDKYWESPERGEKAITQLRWISARDTGPVSLWHFEYWSQLCLREFAPQLVRARPAYRLVRRMPLKPPHILCVIGPVGSGKTIATEVLKHDFGYQEVNSGEVLASILKIPPVPKTPRLDFQHRAWKFISKASGPERLGREIARIVNAMDSDRIVVDGLRQETTLECLKTMCCDRRIGIVYIQTPADLAFKFFVERIAQGATMSEFLATRDAPVEQDVESLISKADAVLYNWKGTLQYQETIHAMMKQLGGSGA